MCTMILDCETSHTDALVAAATGAVAAVTPVLMPDVCQTNCTLESVITTIIIYRCASRC